MDDEVVLIRDDEGTKRRLPLWMIGVAAADQVRNSKEENKNAISKVKKGNASEIHLPKSKRTKKGVSVSLEVDSCLLVKCERKKRGRKLIEQEDGGGCDDEVLEIAADKKRPNRGGRKGQKRPRGKQGVADELMRESSEEIENPSAGEDDGELTMDDLMSIAQEYITTDKHTEQRQSLHTEQDAERRLPAISVSGKESAVLPSAPQSSWKSHRHEEMVSVHNSIETSAGEGTVVNQSRTGDPAQDMLDLLLGPLLKKPAWEESKIGSIKEDMTFGGDITKQRQKPPNDIDTEVVVPLTKKKSSLKDKVAMLLD